MGKFDGLENKFDEVINKASLKSNNNTDEKDVKNIMVYNVPSNWIKILKNSGFSFSSYAKMALIEKMKRDNLI